MAGRRKDIDLIVVNLKRDFGFIARRDGILGVMVFGSIVRGDSIKGRSDIDVCVVAGDYKDRLRLMREIWRNVDVHGKSYDVRVFEDLPLYIKMEVIEEGEVVFTRDVYELYEYFYFYRKLWKDQEHRQKLTPEEAVGLFSQAQE